MVYAHAAVPAITTKDQAERDNGLCGTQFQRCNLSERVVITWFLLFCTCLVSVGVVLALT